MGVEIEDHKDGTTSWKIKQEDFMMVRPTRPSPDIGCIISSLKYALIAFAVAVALYVGYQVL